jgi:hypothetical protein
MVGHKIGGVNVFGGWLALYTAAGKLVGGLGVSGDTSCTDHNIGWKTRAALKLDDVPKGVASGAANGTDNIINDMTPDANGHTVNASGFGHPACDATATSVAASLPMAFPVGPHP